jgi:hypothetical protein
MKSLITGSAAFFVLSAAFVLGFMVRGDMPSNKVIEREVVMTSLPENKIETSDTVLKIEGTAVYVDGVKADIYLAAEAAKSANKKGKNVVVKITESAKVSAVTGLQRLLKDNHIPYEEIRTYLSLPPLPGQVEPTGPGGVPIR